MFQGAANLSLDAKGRMTIPARHRDALQMQCEGRLTLTKHPHGCLLLFPRPVWEAHREEIAKWPLSAKGWQRIFLGSAMDVEMDGAGRVLISPELRNALRYGATQAELMEVMELTSVLGIHTATSSVPILIEELKGPGRGYGIGTGDWGNPRAGRGTNRRDGSFDGWTGTVQTTVDLNRLQMADCVKESNRFTEQGFSQRQKTSARKINSCRPQRGLDGRLRLAH